MCGYLMSKCTYKTKKKTIMGHREEENNRGNHSKIKMKKPILLHLGMVLLSPANPKFNFLSRGKQEQHINESSTSHSYDQ